MENAFKKITNLFKGKTGKEKSQKLLLFCGILAIFLIFISGYIDKDNTKKVNEQVKEATSAETYVQDTENKLQKIISSIKGVGHSEVMIMVESGVEYIYANEGKTKSDVTQRTNDEQAGDYQESKEEQVEYVILKGSDGSEKALVVTEIQPTIKGVVIVCEGGGDPVIQEQIVQVVKVALNISGRRVCVTEYL